MAQAKIYWNRENYQMVEKIFHKSLEVWCEDDTLRLNIAHVLFMQNKYKKAISFYEPIVKKHYDNVSVGIAALEGSSELKRSQAQCCFSSLSWDPDADSLPVCSGGAV